MFEPYIWFYMNECKDLKPFKSGREGGFYFG